MAFLVLLAVHPAGSQTREEVVLGDAVRDSTHVSDFLGYLDKFPDGSFAPLAKRRIREMVQQVYEIGKAAARSQDASEAIRYFRIAADYDYSEAEYDLADMYASGRGVSKDLNTAMFWYRKAAEQGNASAQYTPGQFYESGRTLDKDLTQARNWFAKAAAQGNVDAGNSLAWLFATAADSRFRDGDAAVYWAENVCKRTSYMVSDYVDTLAAAYARSGRWDEAVKTEQMAIQAADSTKIEGYKSRLRLYQRSDAYHQPFE